MRWQQIHGAWAPALLLALGAACGGEATEPAAPIAAWQAPEKGEERIPELNEPPVIESLRIEPREPAPGDRVRAVARASDPDGDRVELGFVWMLEGRRLGEGGVELELGQASRGERLEVVVTASDGVGESEPRIASALVRNRRPILTALALDPAGSVPFGVPVVAKPEAQDPDGDALDYRFEWSVNGRIVDAEGPRLDTRSLRQGDSIQVRVWADDGSAESDPVYSQVVEVGNSRPEILSTPTGVGSDGVFRYAIEARDPDGDRNLRYYLILGPSGMSVDPITGEVTWRPTHQDAGSHPVEIEVRDPRGGRAVQSFELTVASAEPGPEAPPASVD